MELSLADDNVSRRCASLLFQPNTGCGDSARLESDTPWLARMFLPTKLSNYFVIKSIHDVRRSWPTALGCGGSMRREQTTHGA